MAGPLSPWVALVALLLTPLIQAETRPPSVDVYSAFPEELGKPNTFICYTQKFYPPNIEVKILKNGQEVNDVQGKDMSFDPGWAYFVLKYLHITWNKEDEYACSVTHDGGTPKVYKWEPMM